MSEADLEIVDRDIRLSRQSFDGSDPLDLLVRVWIDQAESLRNEIVQLRADLEAARAEIEQLNQARDMIAEEREAWKASAQQSRATEAELRARVERQPSVIRLAEDIIGGHSGHLPGASSSCPRCQWDAGLAALDATQQPAAV